VDSKFHHSLARTHVRLVIPESTFNIENSGTPNDIWSIGLNLRNSLTGAEQTSIDGYLFRWWCSNGAIDTHATSGTWSRRSNGQDADDVYEWARTVVDDVLGGMEGSFDALQQMTDISIEGDVLQILQDIFAHYKVPARNRQAVIDNLVGDTELTAYSLLNAITAVANDPDMDPREQTRLLQIGGDLPYAATDRCNACHRLISV